MSDSYQAVYDATRSRIGQCSPSEILSTVARELLDASDVKCHAMDAIHSIRNEMERPSVLYRPAIFLDGNQWCALYGENIQDGVAGFGSSPAKAMEAFDKAWTESKR